MPHGNIEESLRISSSGDSVEVCGPLFWDGATTITIEHVEVKQGSTTAESNSTVSNQPPQAEWMEDVPCNGPGTFQVGPAEANATVVVLENGGRTPERWHNNVNLTH
jgi:hypothetical protein